MRVSFGVTLSPFLLAATLQHHFKNVPEQLTKTADAIRSQLYIDDLVTGVDSRQEARGLYEEAAKILNQAGMRLCKWMSNGLKLVELLQDGETQHTDADFGHSGVRKVLRVGWNPQTYQFEYMISSLIDFLSSRLDSKRSMLLVLARIFWIFVAPTTAIIKIVSGIVRARSQLR